MIRAFQLYFSSLPPVFIDGLLYVLVGAGMAFAAILSGDDAAKHISPQVLFWAKAMTNVANASTISLKMFRSTIFAEHQKAKLETRFMTRPAP